MKLKRHPSLQRGLSLIELLIGLTIGLLVVVAALGSLSFTQITSTTVGDSARLQQKANTAFRVMGLQLRQTGGIELAQNAGTGMVVYDRSNGVTGFNGWNGANPDISITGLDGGTGPDTLRLSYQDNGTSRDCLGNLATTTPLIRVDNAFYGVEDFQVTYGQKVVVTPAVPAKLMPAASAASATPATPETSDYRQFTAATASIFTPTMTPVSMVQTVTVCLQLRGDLATDVRVGSVQGCSGTVASDGFIRRVYRNTYTLRGLML
jgi:type IV pilus assembly protein PilW